MGVGKALGALRGAAVALQRRIPVVGERFRHDNLDSYYRCIVGKYTFRDSV